ncbi:uncharacterized protein LOC124809017 [Hydra vulgaris]|uniref:Uncharacterized protein LOC124809017 n=1 Tax=Hydra vulgaris TaxID=6087 RepID=A0ABM4BHW7_HYDVU
MLFNALIVLKTFLFVFVTSSCSESLLDSVFWELKPFIFRNNDGKIDGMIPRIFSEAQIHCGNESINIMNFTKLLSSRKEFLSILYSKKKYGEFELAGITQQKSVWFPDDSYVDDKELERKEYGSLRGQRSFVIIKSEKIAVIVPRYVISLPNKMLLGIMSCRQILLLVLLLAVIFGVLIWIAEFSCNQQFSRFFVKGVGTGFWWSLVSMTTVGYGDVVPISIPGKIIASIWLFLGVIIACLVTATVTEVIEGVNDLNIYEKTVAVLESSYELKVARDVYGGVVVPAESYEAALKMVRNGQVFAALINDDVAAWLQKDIENDSQDIPLRVINTLPASLYINAHISMNLSAAAKNVFNCMFEKDEQVYASSIKHFRRTCHTETLYVDSISDMFQKNILYQIIVGLLFVFISFGLIFELWVRGGMSKQSSVQTPFLDESTIETSLFN